jgi:hypothetical protein
MRVFAMKRLQSGDIGFEKVPPNGTHLDGKLPTPQTSRLWKNIPALGSGSRYVNIVFYFPVNGLNKSSVN